MAGASTYPLSSVRGPSALLSEKVSPGGTIVPLMTDDAFWMFFTRGWPDG